MAPDPSPSGLTFGGLGRTMYSKALIFGGTGLVAVGMLGSPVIGHGGISAGVAATGASAIGLGLGMDLASL